MNYKSIFNIIKNYHWQSLFFRYWKILILAFAIPVVVFIFIFLRLYSASQQSEFNQSFVASAIKSKAEFQIIINDLENYYNSALTDSDIIKFLNSDSPSPDTIDDQEVMYNIRQGFYSLNMTVPSIDSLFIYSKKSDYVFSTRGSDYRENHYLRSFIDDCINRKSSVYLYNLQLNEGYQIPSISIVYDLRINNYNHSDGFLLFNINCEKLSEFVSLNYPSEDTLLFSPDGKLLHPVYDIDENLLMDYSKILIDNKESIDSSDYYIQRTSECVLCYMPIDDLGIIMALRMASENQKNLISSFAVTLTMIFILILVLILVFSFYTSLILYKSVANIISEVGIAPIPGNITTNEASFISDKFLTTLKHKSDIEKELTEKVKLLKKSQTLALQTQINPHFIFNTLNLVNLMTIRIAQGNCPPAQILTLLSDIMYYSLQTDKFITTLDEELTYTKKYIQIEQIKYKNKFDFEFDIDESVRNCKTVKFTLQPILENCVEHGLKKLKSRRGMIYLKAYKNNDLLNIIVTDNGNGIDPIKLEEVNNRLKLDDVPTGKHIGLANVNQRIQLIFGKEYGVKITPLEYGLQINITQPLSILPDDKPIGYIQKNQGK